MTGLAVNTSAALAANEAQILHWCEQGREALVLAVSLTDASDVLSLASTLEHAVKVKASSEDAVIAASSLRVAAERRVGELIQSERSDGKLVKNGGDRRAHLRSISVDRPDTEPVTLAAHGITRDQAADYAKLASVPAEQFEQVLDAVRHSARERDVAVTRAAVLRAINPEAERRPDQWAEEFEKFIDACERVSRQAAPAYNTALFKNNVTNMHPWPEATTNHARRILSELRTAITLIEKELNR